jgi:glucose 1-dehydrogenase
MWNLSETVALVTGSSQGIGLAAGQALLQAGAKVVFHSERTLADCPEVQAALANPDARYLQADFLDPQQPPNLVRQAWQAFGRLDVVINNVGTFREPSFLELTHAQFEWLFRLNVWSAIAVTQEFVRLNRAAGRGGRILFTSSLNGSRSEPGHTLYDASKGAINALTRQLAVELAPLGFTTAAIAPGLAETPLTDFGLRSDPQARATVMQQIPLGRIASPQEVAAWFVFLASPASAYATGIIIPVDGGLDAQQMPIRPITANEKR